MIPKEPVIKWFPILYQALTSEERNSLPTELWDWARKNFQEDISEVTMDILGYLLYFENVKKSPYWNQFIYDLYTYYQEYPEEAEMEYWPMSEEYYEYIESEFLKINSHDRVDFSESTIYSAGRIANNPSNIKVSQRVKEFTRK